jgi:hypothetical protein
MTRTDDAPSPRNATPPLSTRPVGSPLARRLAAGATLIGLLVVILLLVPNLTSVELDPGEGTGISRLRGDVDTGCIPQVGTWGSNGVRLLVIAFLWISIAAVAFVVIGSLFTRHLRPYLYFVSAILLICLLAAALCSNPDAETTPHQQEPEITWEDSPDVVDSADVAPSEAPTATRSTLVLVALLVSLSVAGVGLSVYLKVIRPRRTRSAALPEPDGLDELVAQIGETVDRLRLGEDPRSAVLSCYAEMLRILSSRQSLPHAHLTPREFARSLHRAGLSSVHVNRLTEIFEKVRYGHHDAATLAAQALESLESIRSAYTPEET